MIPFVRQMAFEYGRCDQVSPLIRRVIAATPGPFPVPGTGTYIVGRGEGAKPDGCVRRSGRAFRISPAPGPGRRSRPPPG